MKGNKIILDLCGGTGAKKYNDPKEIMTPEEIALCRTNSRKLPFRSFEQWGKHLNHEKQSALRAITPPGFAQAFFKENT